ncbi:MAG: HD domain-containing phosphohydrolase [Candidatus Deferrimicrobiaceae bacterium]
MAALTLNYPVHTLDGKEILPSGTSLSDIVLAEVAERGKEILFPTLPAMEFSTVRRDLLALTGRGVYRTIFGGEAEYRGLIRLLEMTRLPLPVLESLEFYKRNDPYTYHHILLVFALSSHLARNLLDGFEEILQEAAAGPFHDFGKICVPMEILTKKTTLRKSERKALEHHTLAGFILLSYYLKDPGILAAVIARDHHERLDGSGYPRGILLSSRFVEIVAACDVYDALISPRPYRVSVYDNRTALEVITAMAEEGKIGWDVVQVLVSHHRKGKPHPEECKVSVEKRGKPPEGNLYGIILEDDPPS